MAGFALPLLPRAAAATPAGLIAETLVEPEVCASVDGLLETTLECSVTNVDIGGSPAVSNVY